MKFPEFVEGVFIKRISRFSANVKIDGELVKVYVPNSGRMKELLVKGAKVFLSKTNKKERLTKYDLVLVDYNGTLVSIDSRVPNLLIAEEILNGVFDFMQGRHILEVKREVNFANSRFDFRVTSNSAEMKTESDHVPDREDFKLNDIETANNFKSTEIQTAYIEAKSVTLVPDGIAMFPDAPTERGSRHLKELVLAVEQGYRGIVVFIIQRPDAEKFMPNKQTDPEFAKNLKKALAKGVEVYAYRCAVSGNGIFIDRSIPVFL